MQWGIVMRIFVNIDLFRVDSSDLQSWDKENFKSTLSTLNRSILTKLCYMIPYSVSLQLIVVSNDAVGWSQAERNLIQSSLDRKK